MDAKILPLVVFVSLRPKLDTSAEITGCVEVSLFNTQLQGLICGAFFLSDLEVMQNGACLIYFFHLQFVLYCDMHFYP